MKEEWVFALEEDKLQEGGKKAVFPKGLQVLLIKKDGLIYALSDKCAHMACPLGYKGTLDGHVLKCPCHDWRYDIRTGEFIDAKEIKLPVYELKVEGGKIFVKVGDEKP